MSGASSLAVAQHAEHQKAHFLRATTWRQPFDRPLDQPPLLAAEQLAPTQLCKSVVTANGFTFQYDAVLILRHYDLCACVETHGSGNEILHYAAV